MKASCHPSPRQFLTGQPSCYAAVSLHAERATTLVSAKSERGEEEGEKEKEREDGEEEEEKRRGRRRGGEQEDMKGNCFCIPAQVSEVIPLDPKGSGVKAEVMTLLDVTC